MDSRPVLAGNRWRAVVLLVLCGVAPVGCVGVNGIAGTDELVRGAVLAVHAADAESPQPPPPTTEPAAIPSPSPQTDPETQPAPAAPALSPDIGPLDHLGERPRLIHDAPPAAREELAKKLVNPISDLVRVPVQMTYDEGLGPAAANRFVWSVQPFIPFRLNEDWNLITQTRVPVAHQQSPFPGLEDECGLGDITQSFLLAPQDRASLWAVGPTFLFPTAGHEFLGLRKWGAGPTGIALVQEGPWTAGVIANHLWSLAGDEDRPNLNLTSVSPFVGFTTHDAYTVLLEVDVLYDWDNPVDDPWTVPVELTVSRVRKLGRNLVNVGVGARYYASTPENGPEWGVRVFVTYLFRR
jgi:hypothetical protein